MSNKVDWNNLFAERTSPEDLICRIPGSRINGVPLKEYDRRREAELYLKEMELSSRIQEMAPQFLYLLKSFLAAKTEAEIEDVRLHAILLIAKAEGRA